MDAWIIDRCMDDWWMHGYILETYTYWASILTLSYNHSPNTKVCKVSKEENHVYMKD